MTEGRGLAPVVGKALEAGLVVLYVGLVTTALLGHAVPGYRTTAGDALAERTLSAVTQQVEESVPGAGQYVDARVRLDLPATIRGNPYAIRATNGSLVLDHPHSAVGASARLALPERVVDVRGVVRSDQPAVVHVHGGDDGLVVDLERGSR